jgi:hypothetical protein
MARQTSPQAVTRRRFMGIAGLTGVGAIGTAMAPVNVRIEREPAALAQSTGHDHETKAATAQTSSTNNEEPTADEMDAIHEAGIKSFPAKTEGLGGQPLDYEMDGDVKVFSLT